MRVLFAGGVTGGHIAPGVALAEAVLREEPGSQVLFASVDNRLERGMVVGRGLALQKVTRRTSGAAATLLSLPGAWFRARKLIAAFNPDVVVGLGGSASLGPALAAVTGRRPLVLLEQNAVPGRVTRRLARRAARIGSQWACATEALGPHAVFTGSPIRSEILAARCRDRAEARRSFGLAPDAPTLLALGGSQGARPLNRALIDAAPDLAGVAQVIHAAGEADAPAVRSAYEAAGVTAHVAGFLDAMEAAYAAADLALSRAGALSLAELVAVALPAILVPYPHARDGHQRANAAQAAEQGWALAVEQTDLTAARAADMIRSLLNDPARRAEMARHAEASARRDAAEVLVAELRGLLAARPAAAAHAAPAAD
jgi:UDP-N-acetylglucosamine--N-acetylmuramyl-(pentapeptide) pyrophosphoryl-undecaprenol N-acetylglucosamine transferase